MKIYVIGRGAIGKTLAVFLTLNKRNVTLVRGSVNSGESHTEEFEVILNNSVVLKANVKVSTLSTIQELNGLVVLTNKSFGNADLAKTLKSKISGSPVVILQNGLGVEQPFVDNRFPAIYRCVLFVTAQNDGNNGVRVKPVQPCPVGIIKGNEVQLQEITTTLTTENFQFRTESNIELLTWRKAIINCAFNSICPLLETDNGIFHRDREVLALARVVVEECSLVARKKGLSLNANDIIENLLLISKASDGQLISTLQDIRNGQQTEIETLNFEVVRLAEGLGLGDQVQETRRLGELTRLKARLARR